VQPLSLDDIIKANTTSGVPIEDLLTLEDALTRLEAVDSRAAQVVSLKFFSGMSSTEMAEYLQCPCGRSRPIGLTRARGSNANSRKAAPLQTEFHRP
jgi:DNA-directed RNA polymerase specialized sigma24 family protein